MHLASRSGALHPDVPTRTQTPSLGADSDSTSNGLRAQIHSLLPRHTLFHACVQVHQISSVPLVKGEFAVRWKFKHTTSAPTGASGAGSKSTGLLQAFTKIKDKGKGRIPTETIPSVVVSGHGSDSKLSEQSSVALAMTPSSSSSNEPSRVSTPFTHAYASTSSLPSVQDERLMAPIPDDGPEPCGHPTQERTPHRGITEYLPLQEHAVKWEQTLHTTLKLGVSRENNMLEPCPFKLVVMQQVIAGDPDAPKNPRFGAIYLDLAEYAGVEGETTRRYLLRQSKTNATMKLTITMKCIGGDTNYVAPALPKGEILNGVAGLLDAKVFKTRPKNLEVFEEYPEASQHSVAYPSRPASRASRGSFSSFEDDAHPGSISSVSLRTNSSVGPRLDSRSGHSDVRSQKSPMPDMNSLPDIFGPDSTKSLIDSIFNPTTEEIGLDDDPAHPLHNPFVQLVHTSPQSSNSSHYDRENAAGQDDASSLKTDSLRSTNISIASSHSSHHQHHRPHLKLHKKRPPPPMRRGTGSGQSMYYGDVENVVGVTH